VLTKQNTGMVVLNVCLSKLWTEQENRYSQHKPRCDVVKKILKKFIKTVATHGHSTSLFIICVSIKVQYLLTPVLDGLVTQIRIPN
jgi:hypothetical protein